MKNCNACSPTGSFRFTITLFILITVSACSRVNIETPEYHQVYIDPPAEFSVSWTGNPDDPKAFIALLNDIEVSSYFSLNSNGESNSDSANNSAIVNGEALRPLLRHGINKFVVRSPGYSVVEFTEDLEGPAVHITGVTDLGFPSLQVSGYLDDPSPIASFGYRDMSENYIPVDLIDNHFSVILNYGLSGSWTFDATDAAGQTASTPYKRFQQSIGADQTTQYLGAKCIT